MKSDKLAFINKKWLSTDAHWKLCSGQVTNDRPATLLLASFFIARKTYLFLYYLERILQIIGDCNFQTALLLFPEKYRHQLCCFSQKYSQQRLYRSTAKYGYTIRGRPTKNGNFCQTIFLFNFHDLACINLYRFFDSVHDFYKPSLSTVPRNKQTDEIVCSFQCSCYLCPTDLHQCHFILSIWID